ncbi:MAG: hypothetical protein ACK46Y_01145 [Fluviicola sp.]
MSNNNSNNPENALYEQIKQMDYQHNEWWSARQLSKILEYTEYSYFKAVFEKAKEV